MITLDPGPSAETREPKLPFSKETQSDRIPWQGTVGYFIKFSAKIDF